jgi:hypothetical protein
MKEWQRTVVLLIIITAMVGFMIWSHHNYATNFIDTLNH